MEDKTAELSFWQERLETAHAETPVTKLQIEMKEYRIRYILEKIEKLEAQTCTQ
jgi:hypothetical protein